MGQVHGPYDAGDWLTMKMLKENNKYLTEQNGEGGYNLNISRNTSILHDYMMKGTEVAA